MDCSSLSESQGQQLLVHIALKGKSLKIFNGLCDISTLHPSPYVAVQCPLLNEMSSCL
jgi:hypothetical protein